MKYLTILFAILITLSLLVIPSGDKAEAAGPYYVSTTGNNGWAGDFANPWLTIDYAVSQTVPGDTVYIRAGTYTERVNVDVSGTSGNEITYTNYQSEEVIVDGTGESCNWCGIFDIHADYITVDGLKVQNADNSTYLQAAIMVDNGSDYVTINDCVTDGSNASGILAYGHDTAVTNLVVSNNDITDSNNRVSQEAISISHVNVGTVSGNSVHDCHKEGIDVKGDSTYINVFDNEVHDLPGPGIYIAMSGGPHNIRYVNVYNNFVYNIVPDGVHSGYNQGKSAIALAIESDATGVIQDVNVYNNIAGYNTYWHGFNLKNSPSGGTFDNISVYNNTFHEGGYYGDGYGRAASTECQDADIGNFTYANNIHAGDRANRMFRMTYALTGDVITNNLFEQSTETDGSLSVYGDPDFVSSPSTNDAVYKLNPTSPAINAGTASLAAADDYWGTSRPQDVTDDIGAYEYPGDAPPTPEPSYMIIVFPFHQAALSCVFPMITAIIYMIGPLLW